MKTLMILGAGSDIAHACAVRFAKDGYDLILAGRNLQQLTLNAADLKLRYGIETQAVRVDAMDLASHQDFHDQLRCVPDGIICAIGLLGEQDRASYQPQHAQAIMLTNYVGCANLLQIAAKHMVARGSGFIVGIGSVAGDRGRQSNYTYGSAKAGFEAFLSGLRNAVHRAGIRVITVKPGFVATAMTEGMDLPPLLTARPEQVAQDIHDAVYKGRPVIYSRWFWRWIMVVIKSIPESIFVKLKL